MQMLPLVNMVAVLLTSMSFSLTQNLTQNTWRCTKVVTEKHEGMHAPKRVKISDATLSCRYELITFHFKWTDSTLLSRFRFGNKLV